MSARPESSLPSTSTVIKNERVRVGNPAEEASPALPAQGSGPAARSGARCKKSVQLLRENEVVHAIEVRCSCGEATVVQIEYGPKAGQEN